MDHKLDKIANPSKYFEDPADVDKDDSFTPEEKVKLLENWLDDVLLQHIAESENMQTPSSKENHIREIEDLLRKYKS